MEPVSEVQTRRPLLAPEVQRFIRLEQERGYRNLAIKLGLGADPKRAYARLTGSPLSTDSHSPYEDPRRYQILELILGGVEKALTAGGHPKLNPWPVLASLPSGDVHARVVMEPKTQIPVIFFEQGLMQYFFDFCHLIGWAVPPFSGEHLSDDKAIINMARSYTMPFQASDSFVRSLTSYAIEGSPLANAPRVLPPPHNMSLCIVLLNLMERFVVVHELSHLRLDHLKHSQPSRDQEHQADNSSLELVTYMRGQDGGLAWAISYWACELVLDALDLLYRAIAVVEFGVIPNWIDKSHPDPIVRREYLRELWLDPFPPSARVHAARVLCGMSDALGQRLWEFAAAGLLFARQQGARASPMWRTLIDSTFAVKI